MNSLNHYRPKNHQTDHKNHDKNVRKHKVKNVGVQNRDGVYWVIKKNAQQGKVKNEFVLESFKLVSNAFVKLYVPKGEEYRNSQTGESAPNQKLVVSFVHGF